VLRVPTGIAHLRRLADRVRRYAERSEMKCLSVAAAVVLFAACTSGPPTGTDGAADAPPADAGPPPLRVDIGPIDLMPGEERTVCVLRRLSNTTPQYLRQITAHLGTASHHLIVYRSSVANEQLTPMPCHAFSGVQPPDLDESPLIIAQQEDATVRMPDGVGMNLAANQMLRLELHAINTTSAPVQVTGSVALHVVDTTTALQPSDVMLWGNLRIDLPPRTTSEVHFFHRPMPNIHIFGLTSHTHRRGTLATVNVATDDSGDPATAVDVRELHRSTSWAEPPLTLFEGPGLQLPEGQGLHLACHYNNTSDARVTYGESALDNEMCFMWAYFWPAPGGQQACFDLPTAPATQCFPQ
jgi:hypothetical protein